MRIFLAIIFILTTKSLVAQPVLTDVAQQIGLEHVAIMSDFEMPAQGGAAWFDYNNDGYFDLYLTGGSAADALFKNEGNGSFTNVTQDAGFGVLANVETAGVTTGDIDNDGFDDVFVTTFRTDVNYLFLNNGNETFAHQLVWAGENDTANSFSSTFGDLNLDGWLDLYVCNWSRNMEISLDGGSPQVDSESNFFYENNGDGSFTEKAVDLEFDDSLGCALGVLMTDYDNDHDQDIFVANDFGYFPGNSTNRLFQNEIGAGTWTDVSQLAGVDFGMNGMGVAKADLDQDGDMDFYVSNIDHDKLLINSVSGFEEELLLRGLGNDSVWLLNLSMKLRTTGWGVAFLDIDNDMDEDLMVANGDLYYDYPNPVLDSNKLFINNADGTFTDISFSTGIADTYVSRALAYCDYDLDGDLDVFIGITDSIGGIRNSFLYRNDSPVANWLQVKARGIQNNRNGIGVKVYTYINGAFQLREIGGESSFNSQNWRVAHFGLGLNQVVDSLVVIWPGGGTDTYFNISSNQFIEVVEGQGLVTGLLSAKNGLEVYPNPIRDHLTVHSSEVIIKIELFSGNGSLLESINVNSTNSHKINTEHFTSGHYLLKVAGRNGEVIKKLVKH